MGLKEASFFSTNSLTENSWWKVKSPKNYQTKNKQIFTSSQNNNEEPICSDSIIEDQ